MRVNQQLVTLPFPAPSSKPLYLMADPSESANDLLFINTMMPSWDKARQSARGALKAGSLVVPRLEPRAHVIEVAQYECDEEPRGGSAGGAGRGAWSQLEHLDLSALRYPPEAPVRGGQGGEGGRGRGGTCHVQQPQNTAGASFL